jgi:uronate dehydrogenase
VGTLGLSAAPLAAQTWALTGAGGRIAGMLRGDLAARVGRLRLLDVVAVAPEHPGEEAAVADLRDQAAVEAAFAGVDGVLHLGAIADEADFHDLAAVNIVGTFHVLEAARRLGVERVVFASSNHVTGLYPTDTVVDPLMAVRPDGLYGVSKVAGEALGRMYAEKFGLRVACLRIGSFERVPREPRHLSTWLSPADALAALLAAMTSPDLTYSAFYVVSRNRRRWWDLAAGEAIGFDPRDDAERYAAGLDAATQAAPAGGPQGGPHATAQATLAWLTDRSRA